MCECPRSLINLFSLWFKTRTNTREPAPARKLNTKITERIAYAFTNRHISYDDNWPIRKRSGMLISQEQILGMKTKPSPKKTQTEMVSTNDSNKPKLTNEIKNKKKIKRKREERTPSEYHMNKGKLPYGFDRTHTSIRIRAFHIGVCVLSFGAHSITIGEN